MSERHKQEWLRDIDARQRNTVFPDTVQNEGRFWRNLWTGKQPLKLGQWLGILAIFAFFALCNGVIFAVMWQEPFEGSLWQKAIHWYGPYAVVLAAVVAFVVIGNRRARRKRSGRR